MKKLIVLSTLAIAAVVIVAIATHAPTSAVSTVPTTQSTKQTSNMNRSEAFARSSSEPATRAQRIVPQIYCDGDDRSSMSGDDHAGKIFVSGAPGQTCTVVFSANVTKMQTCTANVNGNARATVVNPDRFVAKVNAGEVVN